MRKLALLAALVIVPCGVFAQTADEIVARYLAARGGKNKIKAIRSERVTGTISFGPGAEGPFVVERERSLKMHMEFSLNGATLIRVFDGKSTGWVYNPFSKNPAVEPMTAVDLRNIFDEADFEGPFVDYKEKGNQLAFAGKAEVEGKPAYKVKLTNKNGDVSFFLFDTTTNLLLQWQGSRKVGEQDVPWESFFRDFREVDGLKYPFLIESRATGTDQTQKIIADKIEVNVPIDAARFGKPNPPAPPAAPAAPADDPKP